MEKLFSTLFTSAEDNKITEALDDETENLILNSEITDDEILNAVKSLKTRWKQAKHQDRTVYLLNYLNRALMLYYCF